MAAFYADSSALVKRYVAEVGSNWLIQLADPTAGHDLYTVTLTAPEVIAAVARRARGGAPELPRRVANPVPGDRAGYSRD